LRVCLAIEKLQIVLKDIRLLPERLFLQLQVPVFEFRSAEEPAD